MLRQKGDAMTECKQEMYKDEVDRLRREVNFLQWERQKAAILRWAMLATCVFNSLAIIVTNLH